MTMKTFTDLLTGHTPDALLAIGGGLVSYGFWCIYPPAGFIVAGGMLLAAGWLTAKKGS